jgi:uncharacterized Fe-S cluster-containing radical SAM superfamily protein
VIKPHSFGEFHSPEDVARKLVGIARKKGYRQVRISGGEPTLAKEYLIKVLDLIPKDFRFILETNGILIGHDGDYARTLSRYGNLYVRVSLKGTTEEEFSRLTGADPTSFGLQLQALENLIRDGVATHAAAMVSFSPPENIAALHRRLGRISRRLQEVEIEELVFFNPGVEERLKKAGVAYRAAYLPDNIPPDQV